MRHSIKSYAVIVALAVCAMVAVARVSHAQSALWIMDRYLEKFELEAEVATVRIVMEKHNKHLLRFFVMARKEWGKDLHKTLIKFTKPEEMNGIGLLVIVRPEKDDIWFYIPDLKRAKRLVTTEHSQSFLGSDFAFEDLEPEQMKDYSYERVGMGKVDGILCFKVRATPSSPKKIAKTAYGSRVLWIRKADYFKVREDYYNKNGVQIKTAFYAEPRYRGRGKYKMVSVRMINHMTGNSSLLQVNPMKAEYPVPDSMFTVEFLETGVVY